MFPRSLKAIAGLHPICFWIFNGKQDRIMTMVSFTSLKTFHRWSKEVVPAILILLFTISLPIFLGEFTFLKGWEAIYKGLLRFFRFTLILCLPLYVLLPIESKLGWVVRRRGGVLLHMEEKQDLEIHSV